ncbi:MAG: hypothetical protein H7Y22_11760 [Gemmatimonadaceae bacterium]|nr:hypothetical protein [Gloeobacterales cyanobacterium ES-bin-141]
MTSPSANPSFSVQTSGYRVRVLAELSFLFREEIAPRLVIAQAEALLKQVLPEGVQIEISPITEIESLDDD